MKALMKLSRLLKLTSSVVLAAVSVTLAGCSGYGDGPDRYTPTVTNIVTFNGNADGASHFTYWPAGDVKPASLVATPVTGDIEAGARCLALYYPANGDELASGSIQLISLAELPPVAYEEASTQDIITKFKDSTPLHLLSAWMSGGYLNASCQLPFSQTTRELKLFIDKSTLDLPVIEAYLYQNLNGADKTFMRKYYLSFDLFSLFKDKPAIKSIRLHVNDNKEGFDNVLTFKVPTTAFGDR